MSDNNTPDPFAVPADEAIFQAAPAEPQALKDVINPSFTEEERKQILLPANEAAVFVDGFLQLIQDEKGQRIFKKALSQARIRKVRPANWSKAANAPYYRQQYAEELKPVIDQMLLDGRDKIFLYARYHTVSPKTLYLKLTQAFLFLSNEIDTPDLKYYEARERITMIQEPNGIRLSLNHNSQPLNLAVDATSKDVIHKWKEDVDIFLEEGTPGTKLELNKLQLTEEQVRELDDSLKNLSGIIYTVSTSDIKILKMSV